MSGAVYFTGQSSQFLLSRSATVEAAVYDHTLGWSIPAVATYEIRPGKPVISPPGGTYTAAQSATIGGIDAGDAAYYTTDGSGPGVERHEDCLRQRRFHNQPVRNGDGAGV